MHEYIDCSPSLRYELRHYLFFGPGDKHVNIERHKTKLESCRYVATQVRILVASMLRSKAGSWWHVAI